MPFPSAPKNDDPQQWSFSQQFDEAPAATTTEDQESPPAVAAAEDKYTTPAFPIFDFGKVRRAISPPSDPAAKNPPPLAAEEKQLMVWPAHGARPRKPISASSPSATLLKYSASDAPISTSTQSKYKL